MNYIFDQPKIISQFVATLVPHCQRGFGDRIMTMGVIHPDGRLIAGLVYHDYSPESDTIEISGAATDPAWLTRQTLFLMHYYPFVDARCQMVAMRLPADNEHLLSILARYGYAFVRQRRLFGRQRDGIIATLTDDDWRSSRFNRSYTAALPPPDEPLEEAA